MPSATDVAEAHYDGDFLYLIVSLDSEPPEIRGYRLVGRRLEAADFEAWFSPVYQCRDRAHPDVL